MNLLKSKDCSKCEYSIVYGNKDNIQCISSETVARELFKEDGRYCASFCKYYKQADKKRTGIIEQDKALRFILAGKSEFIMHSTKTFEDFTFNITKASDKEIYFVRLIRGSDSLFAGTLWKDNKQNEFRYSHGKNGKVTRDSIDIKSLLFVLNKLDKGEQVNNLELYSLGKCGYCGKQLNTYQEIETGIHEKCLSYMNRA